MKNKHLTFFICLIITLGLIYEYQYTVVLPPQSNHMWRQADCASLALNYYNNGMHFFEPRIHNCLSSEGNAVGEFPIIYYFVAVLYHLFGVHEYLFRASCLLIFFFGLISLFKICNRLIGDIYFSYLIPLFLFSSPFIMHFANNYLSDVPSLSFVFIAWNLILKYKEKASLKFFWWSMFFFTMAALLKLNSAISFIALATMFFIELNSWRTFNGSSRMFVHVKNNIAGFVISMVLIVAWYEWAIYYNAQHHTLFLGTQSWPGQPIWEVSPEDFVNTLSKIFSHIPFIFSLVTTALIFVLYFFVLSNGKYLTPFLNGIFSLTLIGSILFFLTFFVGFKDNIYYFINLMIAPVFAFICSAIIMKNKFPQVFQSWVFKSLFAVLLILNIVDAKAKVRLYYHNGRLHEKIPGAFYDPALKDHLEKIGIHRDDKVVCFSDCTPDGALYLLNRNGWSGCNRHPAEMDSASMQDLVNCGARYLVLTDFSPLANISVYGRIQGYLGSFKDIYFYKLDTNPMNFHAPLRVQLVNEKMQPVYVDAKKNNVLAVDLTGVNDSLTLFSMLDLGDDRIALRGNNGMLVGIDWGKGFKLFSWRNAISVFDVFKVLHWGSNKITLISFDGRYVCADTSNTNSLAATSTKIGDLESFTLIYK